jgi:hypothetical protein
LRTRSTIAIACGILGLALKGVTAIHKPWERGTDLPLYEEGARLAASTSIFEDEGCGIDFFFLKREKLGFYIVMMHTTFY